MIPYNVHCRTGLSGYYTCVDLAYIYILDTVPAYGIQIISGYYPDISGYMDISG